MQWTVTTPPTSEPIDYATVKTQCRLDSDAEQSWIEGYLIPAARATCEKACNLALMPQTITALYFPGDHEHAGLCPNWQTFRIPRGPIAAITSIKDADGNTISADSYKVESFGLTAQVRLIVPAKLPLTIVCAAGFANAAAVPADLKAAMLAHCAFLFENRGADSEPSALDLIYRNYRSFAH